MSLKQIEKLECGSWFGRSWYGEKIPELTKVFKNLPQHKEIFVEVKNVTLFRNKDTAEFPDAVTSRGTKHLLTLIDAIKKGYKSYLLFLVQIQNMEKFKIAKDIDKEYYNNYLIAKKAGVNFLAYRCDISSKKIFIDKKLKIIDD